MKKEKIIVLTSIIVLLLGIGMFLIVNNKGNKLTEIKSKNKNIEITQSKIQDYLYEIEFDELDYNYGYNEFSKKYQYQGGGCSVVRNGNFFGRNYDWYYDNNSEFVIRVNEGINRHASLGIAYTNIDNKDALKKIPEEKLKAIPFLTTDGINDAGVTVAINVVPTGDKGYTTGTNPDYEGLLIISAPRYILDNAGSVDEAISLLNEKNLYAPLSDTLAQELHMIIADKYKTVVVEFINNKMVVLENENIVTNFYLDDFDKTQKTLPKHAMGIERYNILKEGYESANSNEGMVNLMKQVYYTKTYDLYSNPFWYSEYSGDFRGKDLTTDNVGESYLNGDLNKAGEYKEILEIAQDRFNKKEKGKSIWQTVHSSVYDIANKKLTLIVQENNIEYNFDFQK